MRSKPATIHTGTFTTPRGQRLVFQVTGRGKPVVLCNGLGGTFDAWRHLTGMLATRYQVFSWYYRGLHGSSVPVDRTRVRVVDHVDDLELLLSHWGVERAAFVGWSMGVQVALELYRRAPARLAAFAALNGSPGRILDTVAGPLVGRVLPMLLHAARLGAPPINAAARALTGWQGFIGLGKRVGLFADSLDSEVFGELLHHYGRLEFGLYADTLRGLGEHDAWDVLPRVDIPTAVICGARDLLTPSHVAVRMASQIRGASLLVIPEGTHFVAVERPDLVNGEVQALLERAAY